jgi:hypothetical protein
MYVWYQTPPRGLKVNQSSAASSWATFSIRNYRKASDQTVRADASSLGARMTFTMEQGRMWMQLITLHCTRTEDITDPDELCIFTYNLPHPGRRPESGGIRLESLNNGQDTEIDRWHNSIPILRENSTDVDSW